MPANKSTKKSTASELMHEMLTKGAEQKIPGTDRVVRVRTVDAPTLLRSGKVPDILTPLVMKTIYTELSDKELREFLRTGKDTVVDALAMADALNFIAKESLMDGTKVEELTMGEKRWLFRLAMGPAELLINFRYDEDADVGDMETGKDIQPAT